MNGDDDASPFSPSSPLMSPAASPFYDEATPAPTKRPTKRPTMKRISKCPRSKPHHRSRLYCATKSLTCRYGKTCCGVRNYSKNTKCSCRTGRLVCRTSRSRSRCPKICPNRKTKRPTNNSRHSCPKGRGVSKWSMPYPACKRSRLGCGRGKKRYASAKCGCGCEPQKGRPKTKKPTRPKCPRGLGVSYYSKSSRCRFLRRGCPVGKQRFYVSGCGCGCRPRPSSDNCSKHNDRIAYPPEKCSRIKIRCAQDFVRFDNECGCGCKPKKKLTPAACPDKDRIAYTPAKCKRRKIRCARGFVRFDNECGCGCKELSCGGFTGKRCPRGLSCVDKPGDGCDPKMGGDDCPGICTKLKTSWPELVDKTCEDAKETILNENEKITYVKCLPEGSMVTKDLRRNRVRVFVDEDGIVVRTPRAG